MIRCRSVIGSVVLGCAGCGGGVFDVAQVPLAGKVGGQAWSLGTIQTNAFLSASSDTFFVEAFPETFTPCTGDTSGATGNRVIMNIPKQAGTYALSFAFTQTFYVQASSLNLAATRGRILVEEVTDTMIRGGAHFEFDADNAVNGQFQTPICP
jgi:hypothetical protein